MIRPKSSIHAEPCVRPETQKCRCSAKSSHGQLSALGQLSGARTAVDSSPSAEDSELHVAASKHDSARKKAQRNNSSPHKGRPKSKQNPLPAAQTILAPIGRTTQVVT